MQTQGPALDNQSHTFDLKPVEAQLPLVDDSLSIAQSAGRFLGGGMLCKERDAMSVFFDFVEHYGTDFGSIDEQSVRPEDLLGTAYTVPALTRFTAVDDTYLFAQLVSRALRTLGDNCCRIIDLGSGSNVPTIKALLDNPRSSASVVCVEIDSEAMAIGKENVHRYSLPARYSHVNGSMIDFIKKWQFLSSDLLVANPPYLPCSSENDDSTLVPVNGGEFGSSYLEAILEHPWPTGMTLALQWSSLSNPRRVIELLSSRFDTIYVGIHQTPFGSYTGSVTMRPILERNKKNGKSIFHTDDQGRGSFLFMSSIHRKR